VKVPSLWMQPGRVRTSVSDALLSAYDVFPTLVDYLGLTDREPRPRPGHSFRALLEGGHAPAERDVVVYDEYGPVRMVRTREWKYVHRYPDGPNELYDLVRDPGERDNLVDQPRMRPTAQMLRSRLEAWFVRHVDPALDGARKRVTGCGQLGLVPAEGDGREVFPADPIAPLRVPARKEA
jgi:arylsulfatase A-like enzyme